MVQRVLEGVRPDVVVAGTGPAAFTGLRAGLVTARTLTRAWDVPLYGVSSRSRCWLLPAAGSGYNNVVSVIDARRKELFVLRARPMSGDDVGVLDGPRIVKPADLPAVVEQAPGQLVVSRQELYPELEGAVLAQCTPEVMASLALSHLARSQAGENIDLGTELIPAPPGYPWGAGGESVRVPENAGDQDRPIVSNVLHARQFCIPRPSWAARCATFDLRVFGREAWPPAVAGHGLTSDGLHCPALARPGDVGESRTSWRSAESRTAPMLKSSRWA